MCDRRPSSRCPVSIKRLCGVFGALAATAVFAAPASAAVSFTVSPTSLTEGHAFKVTVKRPNGPNAGTPLDVTVQGVSGTATAGDDFDGSAHVVHFNPNELSKQVSIATVDDKLDEDPETFDITVSSGRVTDPAPQTVTINDNDTAPSVSLVGAVKQPEGTGPTSTPFNFELKLSHPSGRPITVPYTVYDDTAIEPEDFTNGKSHVVIPAGAATATLTVPVVADNVDELDETFTVELSDPDHGTLGSKSTAVGTILNDDVPAISVGDVSRKEGDSGPTALVFPVTLSNPSSAHEITVDWATAASKDGATSPEDFADDHGTVTFSKGETADSFIVWAKGDTVWEPDEKFAVVLSNPTHATLGRAFATGTIVNDDPFTAPAPAAITQLSPARPSSPTAGVSLQPALIGTSRTTRPAARVRTTAPVLVRPGRVRTTLTCPTSARSCRGTVSFFTVPQRTAKIRDLRREMKIGVTRFTARGGQRRTVVTTVPPRILALLRQAGSLRVRAYVVGRSASGRMLTTQALGTLRRS
jgi:hypothetical protein